MTKDDLTSTAQELTEQDVGDILNALSGHREQKLLSDLANELLGKVRGFDVLGNKMQAELIHTCSAMFGAGYVVGIRRRSTQKGGD